MTIHGVSQEPVETNALSHVNLSSDKPTTLLLIHGGISSGADFNLVAPILSKSYHILIPDLPTHGKSSQLSPFTLSNCSRCLAQLVQQQAHDSTVHIIGFSLGASVAADFASTYPGLVSSVMVTGYFHAATGFIKSTMPYFFFLSSRLESLVPKELVSYLMDGADMSASTSLKPSIEYCKAMTVAIITAPKSLSVRTLAICATKSGLVPSGDSLGNARLLAGMAIDVDGNAIGRVVEHKGMRHPWLRQDPELFARTVEAWVHERALPTGFKEIPLSTT